MILIIINVNKTSESELSVLFRILTNYLQLMTTSLAMNSSYPDSMSIFPTEIGGSSETFLSFD